MSGDPNTALGNCILMFLLITACLEDFHYRIYDDGDDCLLFFEECDLVKIKEALLSFFTRCGHELKFEREASTFADIRFCQCAPIFYGDVPYMIKDPLKTLSTLLMCKRDPTTILGREYMTTVAIAILQGNRGVPMVESLCKKIISYGYRSDMDVGNDLPYALKGVSTPSNCINIAEQVAFAFGYNLLGREEEFSSFVFPSHWITLGDENHVGSGSIY